MLLDGHEIKTFANDPRVTIEVVESVSSTNDDLKGRSFLPTPYAYLAEHQTKGRGRLGRSWMSPFGRNIYCSLAYSFPKDPHELSGLSLCVGILAANALASLYPELNPLLKWPNDIYVGNKKMGGILIDIVAESYGNCRAIIGIGLNINMKDVSIPEINQPWTSLEHILNQQEDRNVVAGHLIHHFLKGLDTFREKGLAPFHSEWERYDALKGKQVSISTSTQVMRGIAKGIDTQGCLLVELPSGRIEKFSCGDASLLKA